MQTVSQKDAFDVFDEFLLLQDKKMSMVTGRTIIDLGCIVVFYINKNSFNDENLLLYII
jgi:hypothetical protein